MLNAMIVEAAKDNVIVAIEPIAKGDTVTYNCAGQEKSLTALEDITIYHKLAACDIARASLLSSTVSISAWPPAISRPASMSTATIWKSTGKTWMPRAEKRRIST